MALIPTTKSKISNLLSILTATHKTPSLASASYSNGAARKFRVAPFGGSGRSLSSSVAPLESDMVSFKDYEEYRKALYGGITHKALLVDAVGTLVLPSQPMAQTCAASSLSVEVEALVSLSRSLLKSIEASRSSRLLQQSIQSSSSTVDPVVFNSRSSRLQQSIEWSSQIYRQIGEKYGVQYSETEILNRYRRAYEQPWGRSRLRYVNDGRPFWQYIVSSSTGCSDSQYFEELYNYYTTEKAWHLCDPDAEKVFKTLRNAGVKLAVVSNFDTRLRPVLRALNCDYWFDAVAVSAEVAAEKPNPTIFIKACELLGVKPEDAVHVGDDRRNDIWGARDAGCDAWLWGSDVHSFKEVAQRIGVRV